MYAETHGLILDESTTIRDLGVSAFRGANRTVGGFAVFLQAVKDGKIKPGSYLLVESFDRLSRETPLDAFETFSALINAGIIIVTLIDDMVHSRERITRDWTGLIVSLSKFAQANEESAKKSDRLANAWSTKRREQAEGVIATAKCPGWLTKEGNGFVINEERAAIVRRIFADFTAGRGRGAIARVLNSEGVKPFGHGSEWHGGTVQKITTNQAVIGCFQPHTVVRTIIDGPDGRPMLREKRVPAGEVIERYYPPIVAPDVFFRAQAVAAGRSVVPGNAGGRKGTVYSNLFSGLAKCVLCNRPMVYKDRGPRSSVVLVCSGSRNAMCRNEMRFAYKPLEDAVLEWVQELDLGETRPAALASAESRVVTLIANRDRNADLARSMVSQFDGRSRFANERLFKLEREIEEIENELVVARRNLDEVRGSLPADERRAQIAALRHRMASVFGSELYTVRASLAQSLREIVKVMIFHQVGRVHLVLRGGEKQYEFDAGPRRGAEGYIVRPWMLTPRSDEEFSDFERAVIELHPALFAELAGGPTDEK